MSETAISSRCREVQALWSSCLRNNLEIPYSVRSLSIRQMTEAYNGIGPEWFPEILRTAINRLSRILRPMALVHDCEWSFGPETDEAFDASNGRLRRNGKKLADSHYGWYNPARYWYRFQSVRFAELCQTFGKPAFHEAHRRASVN